MMLILNLKYLSIIFYGYFQYYFVIDLIYYDVIFDSIIIGMKIEKKLINWINWTFGVHAHAIETKFQKKNLKNEHSFIHFIITIIDNVYVSMSRYTINKQTNKNSFRCYFRAPKNWDVSTIFIWCVFLTCKMFFCFVLLLFIFNLIRNSTIMRKCYYAYIIHAKFETI